MHTKARNVAISIACFSFVNGVANLASSRAYAILAQPAIYAQQQYTGANIGGFFSSTYGQQDLSTQWSTTRVGPSINKEMWVFFNGGSEWIETGAKNGAIGVSLTDQINQKFWAGHFLGFKLKDSSGVARFYNLAYGSPYPTGTHNYQINKISSTTWAVYLNSARVLTIPRTINYPFAEGVIVGIESKDTTNRFRSGTYISSWQFLNTSGNWKMVQSAINNDKNRTYGLGFKSIFSYANANNKVTFTHP